MLGRLVCSSGGKDSSNLIFGNAHRLRLSPRAYSATTLFLLLHSSRPMVGLSCSLLDLAIHGGQVEAQLPQVFGLELAGLEFDHHVAAQLEVIEKQVDEELVAAYVQQHLPADEGKARPQLQQELGDVP